MNPLVDNKQFSKIADFFVGMWRYQCYWSDVAQANAVQYCVTLLLNGKHVETNPCDSPDAAMKEAVEIVEDFHGRGR